MKCSYQHAQRVVMKVKACQGFVLLEIIIAIGLFAAVAVSLVKALQMTSKTAVMIQDGMRVDRVLRSAMTEALANPYLEEGTEKDSITELTGDDRSFFSGEIETIVEPMELENEDGQLLQNMYRIAVVFYWRGGDGEWQEQRAETWRYGNLYRP
ncbi:MAG: PulJ/GspJ family protein [Akkermansiaceae bacterium]